MTNDSGFSTKLLMLLICLIAVFLSCMPGTDSETVDVKVNTVTEEETQDTGGLPPLVIGTSSPLLLDEPTDGEKALAGAAAKAARENAACFVCHANYQNEFLANSHARANISCFNCHGESSAHQNDENNITAPEILYSADKIDPFCRGCHKTHDISPRDIIADWMKKKAEKKNTSCEGCHQSNDIPPGKVVARWKDVALDKTDPGQIVCTDCHGDHRMKVRTVIWDKKTGKLLRTNRGD
jgi:hypothetical protein